MAEVKQEKSSKKEEICFSSGFDSELLASIVMEKKIVSRSSTNDLIARCMELRLPTPAYVYHVHYNPNENDL